MMKTKKPTARAAMAADLVQYAILSKGFRDQMDKMLLDINKRDEELITELQIKMIEVEMLITRLA
jgi:hypothetical protein